MRLMLDMDGVLVDWNRGFLDLLIETTGKTLVPDLDAVSEWNWPQAAGYTEAEVKTAWEAIAADPNFWQRLPPRPDAQGFLDHLWRHVSASNYMRGTSIEVYFLTKRSGLRVKDQTELWLAKHGYLGKPPTVLIVRGEKGPIVKHLGITHAVDDNLENLENIREHAPRCQTVLWTSPWNTSVGNDGVGARRAATFTELETLWSLR